MALPVINIGDPQPADCPNCEESMGYKYSDYMKIWFESFHKSDGSEDGGAYSDSTKILNRGVTAICVECNSNLPFKLNR